MTISSVNYYKCLKVSVFRIYNLQYIERETKTTVVFQDLIYKFWLNKFLT